jgi:hypothetical protein
VCTTASGRPLSREGIYTPSIAPGPRDRLWSWNDLVNLRFIDWLRWEKPPPAPRKTETREIHRTLDEIRRQGLDQEDYSVPEIRSMYPEATPAAIKQAIEFEQSLTRQPAAA